MNAQSILSRLTRSFRQHKTLYLSMISLVLGGGAGLVLRFTRLPSHSRPAGYVEGSLPVGQSTETYGAAGYRAEIEVFCRQRQTGGRTSFVELEELLGTINAWMKADPADCANYLAEVSGLNFVGSGTFGAFLEDAAHHDPLNLIKIARNFTDVDLRERTLKQAFQELDKSDPEAALSVLPTMPENLRLELEYDLAQAWIAKEGGKALDKLFKASLSPGTSASRLFEFALKAAAKSDPDTTMRYVSAIPEDKVASKMTYLRVLADAVEPEKAVQLLEQLLPSASRGYALTAHLSTVIGKNPEEAINMINGAQRDAVICNAVGWAASDQAKTKPELGAKLLNSIPSERQRVEVVQATVNGFKANDIEKASKWLAAIDDPLTKSRALKLLQQRKILPVSD